MPTLRARQVAQYRRTARGLALWCQNNRMNTQRNVGFTRYNSKHLIPACNMTLLLCIKTHLMSARALRVKPPSPICVVLGLACARGTTVVCRAALARGRRHWGAGHVFGLRRRIPLVRARRPRVHPPHCTQHIMTMCLYE